MSTAPTFFNPFDTNAYFIQVKNKLILIDESPMTENVFQR